MWKKVLVAGVLGGIVLLVWTLVINGVFGFNLLVNMKPVPDERRVYAVLKENIVVPGRYVCNPALTKAGMYPLNEPVFAIQYGGVGHEAAGRSQIVEIPVFFVVPLIAAWMLSITSERILSNYFRKVLFIAGIGFLIALFAFLTKFGIGGYPLHDMLLLVAYDLFTWILLGVVIAWRIKPEPGRAANS